MTALHQSPIFGPIQSRRLGVSLGINLLPGDGKRCSFDCIYCECGFNKERRTLSPLPTRQEVAEALNKKLAEMEAEGLRPDVFTFAGNGEPTLHPQFAEIIDDTIALRNKFFPEAKVSVLSNSTMIQNEEVFEALMKVDNNILKLDTVSERFINLVDRPAGNFDLSGIIEKMKRFGKQCIIQTMFLHGTWEGEDVSNITDDFVAPWLDAIEEISPKEVMIYTIDRDTPAQNLSKVTKDELDRIAEKVRARGLKCQVSY